MTIKQLIDLPDDVSKMTNAQLEEHLKIYFPITRSAKQMTLSDLLPADIVANIEAARAAKPKMKLPPQKK
jgi:hypothetical protein